MCRKVFINFSAFLFPILPRGIHFFGMRNEKHAQHKSTFSQILADVEKDNSEKLMSRARLANRLAKRSRGDQRQSAYSVKSKALNSLVKKMPTRIDIRKDIILTDFVVIELKNTNVGLHFPISSL